MRENNDLKRKERICKIATRFKVGSFSSASLPY